MHLVSSIVFLPKGGTMFDIKEFQITATNRSEAMYGMPFSPTTCISKAPTRQLNASHRAVSCVLPAS
jgi:hypothetical protein